jgi:hypothetical protein
LWTELAAHPSVDKLGKTKIHLAKYIRLGRQASRRALARYG